MRHRSAVVAFGLAVSLWLAALPARAQAPQGGAPPSSQLPAPNPNATAQETAADALFHARDWAGAAKAFEAVTKAAPGNARAWFALGASLHEGGQFARAAEAHLEAVRRGFAPPALANFRALRAYARAGNANAAFTLLDTMLTAGFFNVQPLETHTDLASLRSDARYADAVRRVRINADPCNANPAYRQLDFWIGTWEVQTTGTPAGTPGGATNVIEKILNGCALWENWAPQFTPGHGKGLHLFNASTGAWEQHWVTASGAVANFAGEFKGNTMHYTVESTLPNGTKSIRVTKIYPLNKDSVRQHGEQSIDGGKTWTPTFDLTYYRKAAN